MICKMQNAVLTNAKQIPVVIMITLSPHTYAQPRPLYSTHIFQNLKIVILHISVQIMIF